MVRKHLLIASIVCALGVAAGLTIPRLFLSEEAKIAQQFSTGASLMSKDGDENPAAALMTGRSIGTLFHDPCRIKLPETGFSGTFSPDEIASNAVRIRSYFEEVSLLFHDLNIDIVDESRAKAVFTAQLRGKYRAGNTVMDLREMRAELTFEDGQWLFSSIETVEVLRR